MEFRRIACATAELATSPRPDEHVVSRWNNPLTFRITGQIALNSKIPQKPHQNNTQVQEYALEGPSN